MVGKKQLKDGRTIGVDGVKINSGYVYDEFLPKLRDDQGRRIYREMQDNDDTVGSIMLAIENLATSAKWRVQPATLAEDAEAARYAMWLESIKDDMEGSWEDFIVNALTMLWFGWSYFEIVLKRREGMDTNDLSRRSRYNDGTIGVRKLAPRTQESLERWLQDGVSGDVTGMVQRDPNNGNEYIIPLDKALHFVTTTKKGSPEGFSVLRRAYRSWWMKKNIQEYESIAIERELNGLPVIRIPAEYLTNTSEPYRSTLAQYEKVARDLKFNQQGGLVIPSDRYVDDDGKITNNYMVEVELISAKGTRAIDTDKIIRRYDAGIARSMLADMVILGGNERGSFALSKNKTQIFVKSVEGFLQRIAATINRQLVTKLWAVNGFPAQYMPSFVPGSVAPVDIRELGEFISRVTATGSTMVQDPEVDEYLRDAAGLPKTRKLVDEDNEVSGEVTDTEGDAVGEEGADTSSEQAPLSGDEDGR